MNNLGFNVVGKVVVFPARIFAPDYQDLRYRLWRVLDGFGAHTFTAGRTVICQSLLTGERASFDAMQMERLATEEEIAQVHTRQVSI